MRKHTASAMLLAAALALGFVASPARAADTMTAVPRLIDIDANG